MLTDSQRHDLYIAALNSWGQGPADALMSLIPPDGWDDFARKSDIDHLRAHVDAQFTKFVAVNVAANIGAMIGLAGLVLAAAKLS